MDAEKHRPEPEPGSPLGAPAGKTLQPEELADYLGLAPATVSLVLNRSPLADTISAETKKPSFRRRSEV
jgi:hypothetical protein